MESKTHVPASLRHYLLFIPVQTGINSWLLQRDSELPVLPPRTVFISQCGPVEMHGATWNGPSRRRQINALHPSSVRTAHRSRFCHRSRRPADAQLCWNWQRVARRGLLKHPRRTELSPRMHLSPGETADSRGGGGGGRLPSPGGARFSQSCFSGPRRGGSADARWTLGSAW